MNEKKSNYPAQGWIKILFVTAALLMASSLTAYAQGESVPPEPCEDCTAISGVVRTCAGAPLPGVTVSMVGQHRFHQNQGDNRLGNIFLRVAAG